MTEVNVSWKASTVAGISSAVVGGGTPARGVSSLWAGDIPWVTPGELTGLKGKYLETTAETIGVAGLASSGARLLPEDALLVTTRATLGSVALTSAPVATNQGFRSIVFMKEAHPDFYYHVFKTLTREMTRRASGTTFLEISGKEFGEIEVPFPPFKEQRRIAEILDAVDSRVRGGQRIVSKLAQLKAGMAQRAFDTFQGERVALGSIAEVKNGTTPSRARSEYWHGGTVPWLASGKVNDYRIQTSSERVTARALSDCGLRLLPPGSIVIGMIGQGKTRGMSARLEIAATINQNLAGVVPGSGLRGDYLHQYLVHSYDKLRSASRGSNQDALNTRLVADFKVPFPSLERQQEIASALDGVDSEADSQKLVIAKLLLIKQGLAEDLLNGRVRVDVGRIR